MVGRNDVTLVDPLAIGQDQPVEIVREPAASVPAMAVGILSEPIEQRINQSHINYQPSTLNHHYIFNHYCLIDNYYQPSTIINHH